MVGCNSYRQPSVLAKITSTIDVISGGRLDWGIGAGWYENEYKGYGFEFPKPKDRIGMLTECVEIVRSMWTETGDELRRQVLQAVSRANCDPKPLQQPHPPIWIGGGGEQLTLRVVARHADCSNFGGQPDEWARKREILKGHCAAVGRDEETIRKTWSPEVFIRSTEAEVAAAGSLQPVGRAVRVTGAPANLVGTPEQVCEKIQQYVDLGCTGFIPWAGLSQHRDARSVRDRGHAELPLSSASSRPALRSSSSAHASNSVIALLSGCVAATARQAWAPWRSALAWMRSCSHTSRPANNSA